MQTAAEHRTAPTWPDAAAYLLAVLFGCLAIYVDDHNDEVQAAVLVLLVGGVALGLLGTRARWIAAIVLGLSIILSHVVAHALHLGTEFAQSAPNAGMLLPLIPALLGTAVGVALRTGARRAIREL